MLHYYHYYHYHFYLRCFNMSGILPSALPITKEAILIKKKRKNMTAKPSLFAKLQRIEYAVEKKIETEADELESWVVRYVKSKVKKARKWLETRITNGENLLYKKIDQIEQRLEGKIKSVKEGFSSMICARVNTYDKKALEALMTEVCSKKQVQDMVNQLCFDKMRLMRTDFDKQLNAIRKKHKKLDSEVGEIWEEYM